MTVKLNSIRLQNWGPYRGSTAVNLAVEPSAPIVLIHGENMRGKTSFLRAITWCLYGRIFLQDGRTRLDHLRLVNTDELETGDTEYLIELSIEHEGESFTLTRSGVASINEFGERRSTPVKTTLITAAGTVFPEQNIPDVVEQMLPESISDFFLFDGEMLIRFDERLREDAQSKRAFIRQQVERALGLPFLKGLLTDLSDLNAAVGDELTKGARADARAKKVQEELAAVDAELVIYRDDHEELLRYQEQLRARIEELDTAMRGVEDIRDSYFKREALVEQAAGAERNIRNLSTESAEFAENYWWFPIASRLAQESELVVQKISDATLTTARATELKFELNSVMGQMSSTTCTHCGQVLPPHAHDELRIREAELRRELESLPETEDVAVLHARLQGLTSFRGAAGIEAQFRQISQSIGRERLELHRITMQVVELNEVLAGNSLDVQALGVDLDRARGELATSSEKIERNEAQTASLKQKRGTLLTDFAKLQGTSPLLARRVELYAEAVATVERSLDSFRQLMRAKVEAQASEIFRALTTEPNFAGIRLNEDYSLAVLHDDGTPVDLISAGGNQILTMSFIGALGASASGEAPLVMDTPLGRLDLGHRSRILAWLTKFSSQVILFVQSGEFEPERDRALLGTSIGRELAIRRNEAEESTIEEVIHG